jgi:hypothetical protein
MKENTICKECGEWVSCTCDDDKLCGWCYHFDGEQCNALEESQPSMNKKEDDKCDCGQFETP